MMNYSIAEPAMIIIDHTEAEPAYYCISVGKQMLYKIVEMASEKKIKIIPMCPYVATVFRKSDDIMIVLKS